MLLAEACATTCVCCQHASTMVPGELLMLSRRDEHRWRGQEYEDTESFAEHILKIQAAGEHPMTATTNMLLSCCQSAAIVLQDTHKVKRMCTEVESWLIAKLDESVAHHARGNNADTCISCR